MVLFEVKMRDGSTSQVEAAFIEVTNGPVSSSYTLLAPVPGYAAAIVAAFPVDLVESVQLRAAPARPGRAPDTVA